MERGRTTLTNTRNAVSCKHTWVYNGFSDLFLCQSCDVRAAPTFDGRPGNMFALWNKDMTVKLEELETSIETTILDEAKGLIYGARQGAYGHPFQDFSKTALIWQAILGIPVTPEQVALCLIGVKISREVNKHGHDNIVDMIGYAGTLDMVVQKRNEMLQLGGLGD